MPPAEDFYQTLKAAGASEAFLKALRAAKPPEPASAKKPLNQVQVFALLAGQVPSHRVTMLVQERGLDFEPTDDYLQEVRLAGGEDELIRALKRAQVTKPAAVDPATQTKRSEVREHVARGADLMKRGRADEAEQEYRAAIQLDPQNADLWASLSDALNSQSKGDEAISAAREAVRLDPANEPAHVYLAIALRDNAPCGVGGVRRLLDEAWKAAEAGQSKQVDVSLRDCHEQDLRESISQFREAIGLNPDDEWAHYQLGDTLDGAGNRDAAFEEYSAALRLNPNYAAAHFALGNTLGIKGDLDGAIIETRAAVRLDPKVGLFHGGLAHWLEKKGDQEEALTEYREAAKIFPLGYEREYEAFVQKVNATRQQEKLQHWLGTWVFDGLVKSGARCGEYHLGVVDVPNYSFRVLTISPSGQVGAQVEHPLKAGENQAENIRNPKPDWFGTATETSLVLTMDPVPPGTVLSSSDTLKGAAGRIEAHREGDRYSVEFTYYHAWSSPKLECERTMKFSGEMKHP